MKSTTFDETSEKTFLKFYDSLREKESRRFAGSLYQHSKNMAYICGLLNISEKTVRKGLKELGEDTLLAPGRQRVKGGGRKAKYNNTELNIAFNEAIVPYTAGDPMQPDIIWTNLSHVEISVLLKSKGFDISKNTVKKVLKHNGFKKRKIQKRKSLKVVQDRDAQFNEINKAKEEFKTAGNPVISVDTKKKKK
jgi:predicted transcriptional regulator/phosphoribosylformylglycinamidine (FGAM) synthase PurS component